MVVVQLDCKTGIDHFQARGVKRNAIEQPTAVYNEKTLREVNEVLH